MVEVEGEDAYTFVLAFENLKFKEEPNKVTKMDAIYQLDKNPQGGTMGKAGAEILSEHKMGITVFKMPKDGSPYIYLIFHGANGDSYSVRCDIEEKEIELKSPLPARMREPRDREPLRDPKTRGYKEAFNLQQYRQNRAA